MNRKPRLHSRMLLKTSILAAMILASGCSDAGKKYVETTGKLLIGGKPAEGALVTLVPTTGPDDSGERPSAIVAADGSFSVTSFVAANRKNHTGAPPGKYSVMITWFPPAGLGTLDPNAPQVDRLGGRYRDPAKSPFSVVVKDTKTELEPIELKETDTKRKP